MTQPTTASGRTLSQPLFVPTLMPMHSLSQQAVLTSGSVGTSVVPPASMTSVITCGNNLVSGGSSSSAAVLSGTNCTSLSSTMTQPHHTADLYLCNTSKNASEPVLCDNDGSHSKPSIQSLEDSYKELKSRNIKDSLSSFLLDMPGEFDGMDTQDTSLRHLLEQRLVTRREFHPLSGQALLGFRLLPGALPDQVRIDPTLPGDNRSQHRKRKHKHRGLDKVSEEGNDYVSIANKVKMPGDAYSFVKDAPLSAGIPTPVVAPHPFTAAAVADRAAIPPSMTTIKAPARNTYTQPLVQGSGVTGVSSTISHDPLNPFPGGKKKKKEKRSKEKKKDKKEKKKKKDKHHSQDPPTGLPATSAASTAIMATHPTNTYNIP